jgi:HlyD family secretion protein
MYCRKSVINIFSISLLIVFQGVTIIEVFAASTQQNIAPADSIIDKINVRRGEQVKAGAVIARLRGWEVYEAKVAHAKQSVELAKINLAKIRGREREEIISAQKSFVAAQKLEVELLVNREKRYRQLRKTNSISLAEYEEVNTELGMANARLQRQKSILNGYLSGRSEEIAEAEIEIKLAETKLKEAQAQLELQYIRAPLNGEILDLLVYPGERIESSGAVVTMGDTKNMMVLAEVYESDISHVKLGATAQIYSRGLGKKFDGKVVEIQHCMEGGRIFSLDPSTYVDRRIVLVHIRPNTPDALASFCNAQVAVTILVSGKK